MANMTALQAKDPGSRDQDNAHHTSSRQPYVILSIANLVATALTIQCCRFRQDTTREVWPVVIVGSALGSLSALAGIIYVDSSMHLFFMGLAIVASVVANGISTSQGTLETISSVLILTKTLFLVFLASRLSWTRKYFRLFSVEAILNPIMIVSACALPTSTFLLGLTKSGFADRQVPVTVPVLVAIATLGMSGFYYRNRSHKHGNLLICKQKRGMAVVATVAMAITIRTAIRHNSAPLVLPLLVGSAMTTLLAVFFCWVADAWYVVGSTQFRHVSLDTAALLVYAVAPVLVLLSLACDRYGDQLTSHWSPRSLNVAQSSQQAVTSGLLLMLALASMIGIPVIHMLSPLGGYLFSNAYLHGNANTRRLALCVRFSDLATADGIDERLSQNFSDQSKLVTINIFVTADDLLTFGYDICTLRSNGHAIGICSNTVEELVDAYDEYIKLLGAKPLWYMSAANSPDALTMTHNLQMKVAFWSHHIAISGSLDRSKLQTDVAKKNGGVIIYLTNESSDADTTAATVEMIVENLDAEGYSFFQLSIVTKQDSTMRL